MSLISKVEENKYTISKICSKTKEVTGIQTNEAPTKCILHLLEENNEQLDKIIYIASSEVINHMRVVNEENTTTESYFKNSIKKYCKLHSLHEPEFEAVNEPKDMSEDKSEDMGKMLKDIIEKINKDDNVYIDTTGGRRDYVNILHNHVVHQLYLCKHYHPYLFF